MFRCMINGGDEGFHCPAGFVIFFVLIEFVHKISDSCILFL